MTMNYYMFDRSFDDIIHDPFVRNGVERAYGEHGPYQKIEIIKKLRVYTNLSLKDAKDVVEYYLAHPSFYEDLDKIFSSNPETAEAEKEYTVFYVSKDNDEVYLPSGMSVNSTGLALIREFVSRLPLDVTDFNKLIVIRE